MKTPTPPAATRSAVNHELFLLGYKNLPVTGGSQMVLSTLTVLASRSVVQAPIWTWWLTYMLLAGVVYWFEFWNFRDYAKSGVPNADDLRRWKLHRQVLQFFSGLGWGGLGFLLVPGAEVHNVLIMTVFAGMIGYSAAGNAANDVAGFSISAFGLTALLVSQLSATFGKSAMSISIMCVFYASALTVVVKNTHAALRETIRLRIANQALAVESAAHAARAEKANRDKSEFLAAASHDLRQPVHALLLLIEAYRQGSPEAANHPLMRQIAAAGHSISGLFNALMELSRLESGTEKSSPAPMHLPSVLAACLAHVRPEADRKGLVVRSFVGKRLEHLAVCTDKVLLERVIGNLLTNAVRYTTQGGLLLSLRKAHGGGGVWLEVWDTGLGIAPEEQTRIFDPYVQIGNRERDRTKGLGLGLAIVRHATELLGLQLSLHSRVGTGSCFRLHIPPALACESPQAPEDSHAQDAARKPQRALVGRRILLIDDDPMVLQSMQALLGGWQVDLRCADGRDASVFAVCEPDWTPECVISDFRLPGALHGIALLDALLERYPQAVGILQTGELAHKVQAEAEEAGYLVLSKPVSPHVLSSTLGAVLERRSVERLP